MFVSSAVTGVIHPRQDYMERRTITMCVNGCQDARVLPGPVEMDMANRPKDAQCTGRMVCPKVMHLIRNGDTNLAPFELL